MSAPKHLWSGDWRQDSAATARELAEHRAATTQTDGDPTEQTRAYVKAPRRSLFARLAAMFGAGDAQSGGTASAATTTAARPAPDQARPLTATRPPARNGATSVNATQPTARMAPAGATAQKPPLGTRVQAALAAAWTRLVAMSRSPQAKKLRRSPVAVVVIAALVIAAAAFGLTTLLNSTSSSPSASSNPSASSGPGSGPGSTQPSTPPSTQPSSPQPTQPPTPLPQTIPPQTTQPQNPTPAPTSASQVGWLGVQMAGLPPGGVVIVTVAPGSPAEAAGLEPGDVITQINGRALNSPADVGSAISGLHAGAQVQLQVSRGSTLFSTHATLANRPARTP